MDERDVDDEPVPAAELYRDAPVVKELSIVGLPEEKGAGEMVACLRNPLIETTAKRLKNYLILIRLDRRITSPLAQRTLREHMEILEACARRDADQAEAALVRHFQAALQRILGMF